MKDLFLSVLREEGLALVQYSGALDNLNGILDCLLDANKIILSGVGKSGLIARKISATLSSTGSPSIFLDPVQAMHGDFGIVKKDDVLIAISYSGDSSELSAFLPHIKSFGVKIISMSSRADSVGGTLADFFIDISVKKEACLLNVAPTTSTTLTLAIGDALAICLMKKRGFSTHDFAKFHPGGSLGRNLFTKVKDIMQVSDLPLLSVDLILKDALFIITQKCLGNAIFVDADFKLLGVLSDGDLRRAMMGDDFDLSNLAFKYASHDPKFIDDESVLAVDALDMIRRNKIQCLVVTDKEKRVRGALHLHMLIKSGFSL